MGSQDNRVYNQASEKAKRRYKMVFGSAPVCPGCKKHVYPVDQCFAADRTPFHRQCIYCAMRGCRNELTERSIRVYEDANICEKCYDDIFKEKSYGLSDGQESIAERRAREEAERLAREAQERAKRERKCPACDKKTREGDSEMVAPDIYYHKTCLKCCNCDRAPDENEEIIMAPMDPGNAFSDILQPLCKFCYAKKFKVSAMKIAEIVEIAPSEVITISLRTKFRFR